MATRNEENIAIKLYCILNGLRYLGTFEDDNELAFCKQALPVEPKNILSVNYKILLKNLSLNMDNIIAFCIGGEEIKYLGVIEDTLTYALEKEFNITWSEEMQLFMGDN